MKFLIILCCLILSFQVFASSAYSHKIVINDSTGIIKDTASKPYDTKFTIFADGLTNLKIGDSLKQMYKEFKGFKIHEFVKNSFIIKDGKKKLFVIWSSDGQKIRGINIFSEKYKFQNGVHVGMRISEVVSLLDDVRLMFDDDLGEEYFSTNYYKKTNYEVQLFLKSDDGKF